MEDGNGWTTKDRKNEMRWKDVIGGSRGAWGARAPPRAFEMCIFLLVNFVLVYVFGRVLPNWFID